MRFVGVEAILRLSSLYCLSGSQGEGSAGRGAIVMLASTCLSLVKEQEAAKVRLHVSSKECLGSLLLESHGRSDEVTARQ